MYHTCRDRRWTFFRVGWGVKCVDAIPAPLASCHTAPIILCRCLKRTNVYCYYKAAFVVIACALCPLLLVSALLSFCAGLGGLVQPAASAALWLEKEGGRMLLSRTLCFIFIKRAAFDLLPLWRVTAWTAAPHCCQGNRAFTTPLPHPSTLSPRSPSCHPPAMPPPILTITACHCPPTTSTSCSLTLRPMHQLINFSIIIDIAALLKSSDFCQGHPCWKCAPASSSHLPSWETRQTGWKNGELTGRQTCWS